MAAFACKTRDAKGVLVEKTIHAASQREAVSLLEQGGLFPIKVTEVGQQQAPLSARPERDAQPTPPPRARGRRVKRKELLQFSLQLSSSLSAGVAILGGLQSIRRQTTSEAFQAVLTEVIADIEAGLPLSEAMARHPRAFPTVYASTIAAGEKSGTIDEMLNNQADFLEAEMAMISDVRSALLYPAIVLCVLTVAISVLIIFVVPRFATFYSGFNAELPLVTRILVDGSTALADNILLGLVGLAAFAFGCVSFARSQVGRRFLDRAFLKIPVVGGVIETAITLHIVQMIGLFTRAGVPIIEGLETIARATSNTKIKRDMAAVIRGVTAGETMSQSMEAAGCFPPSARQMLSSGESTGSLERACFEVAKHYKKELHYKTKNLATFIEPVMTLVLAVVVLFVALAAFLPMWDLVKVVGK